MQEIHDAGDERSGEAATAETEGVHENPNRVELYLRDNGVLVGTAESYKAEVIQRMHMKDGTVNWRRISFDKFKVTPATHLLMLGGTPPVHIFMASNARMKAFETERVGPLLFLSGVPSAPWEVPNYLTKVVLAQLMFANSKLNVMETFAELASYEVKRLQKKG